MARSVLAVFFFLFLLDISIEFNPQIRAFLGLFLVDTFTVQLTAFSLLVVAVLVGGTGQDWCKEKEEEEEEEEEEEKEEEVVVAVSK